MARWAAVILAGWLVCTALAAGPWYVDKDVVGGLNDGSSWENAWSNIQSVNTGVDDDGTVYVKAGTYDTAAMPTYGYFYLRTDMNGYDITFEESGGDVVLESTNSYGPLRDIRTSGTVTFNGWTFRAEGGAATYGLVYLNNNAAVEFADCIFDAQTVDRHYAIHCESKAASTRSVALDGCTLNLTKHGINSIDTDALSVVDCTLTTEDTTTGYGLVVGTTSDTSLTSVYISGCTFSVGGRFLNAGNATSTLGSLVVDDCDIGLGTATESHGVAVSAVMTVGTTTITDCHIISKGIPVYLPGNPGRLYMKSNLLQVDAAAGPSGILWIGSDPVTSYPFTRPGAILGNTLTYSGGQGAVHALYLGDEVSGYIVANNTIISDGGYGLVIKGGDDNLILANSFYGSNTIFLKADAERNHIIHNACYAEGNGLGSSTNQAAISLVGVDSPSSLWPAQNIVVDNIFAATDSGEQAYSMYVISEPVQAGGSWRAAGNFFDRNVYYATGTAVLAYLFGAERTSLSALQQAWQNKADDATGWQQVVWDGNPAHSPSLSGAIALGAYPTNDANSVVDDPLFRNPAAYLLGIQVGSPAMGIGYGVYSNAGFQQNHPLILSPTNRGEQH